MTDFDKLKTVLKEIGAPYGTCKSKGDIDDKWLSLDIKGEVALIFTPEGSFHHLDTISWGEITYTTHEEVVRFAEEKYPEYMAMIKEVAEKTKPKWSP